MARWRRGTWEIEWPEGPFLSDVGQLLLHEAARVDGDGCRALRDVVEAGMTSESQYYFPVALRALDRSASTR